MMCYTIKRKEESMKILLVEDNESIIKGLEFSLKENGYEVTVRKDVNSTIVFLEHNKVDFIILDVLLPDGNGFSLYQNQIQNKNIPTLFLTAKDEEEDIIKGLLMGAEDYITKPFSTKELLVRISKFLLRFQNNIIKLKDITFDMEKMIVYKKGIEIELTSLELKLLHLLFLNIGKVVSRITILDNIWKWTGNEVDDHTITVYLKRIREKLKSNIIITIKGIGYRIDKDEK